jgi:hypothetical protein
MVLARAAYEVQSGCFGCANVRQTARFHEQLGREFESLRFEDDASQIKE